eukprot:6491648-Amphidinium_carterae.3
MALGMHLLSNRAPKEIVSTTGSSVSFARDGRCKPGGIRWMIARICASMSLNCQVWGAGCCAGISERCCSAKSRSPSPFLISCSVTAHSARPLGTSPAGCGSPNVVRHGKAG